MQMMVGKILRGYGKEMILLHGGRSSKVKAFWQAETGKSEHLAKLQPGLTGLEDTNRFIYIGPVEPKAVMGDEIVADGVTYVVRNAQTVRGGDADVYVWGICVEKGGVVNGA